MYDLLEKQLREHFGTADGWVSDNDDVWDILHKFGKISDALMCAALFCPRFLEVDGSVLLDKGAPETVERFTQAKENTKGEMSLSEIESSFNYLELSYVFSPTCEEFESDSEVLASFLVEAWRSQLFARYPTRRFQVEVLPPEVTGHVTWVQFFEIR